MELPGVTHMDHDVAPGCEPREETPSRVGQHEELCRGGHAQSPATIQSHDLALVKPKLLIGYACEFFRRRRLLDDTVIRSRRRDFHRPPFEVNQ